MKETIGKEIREKLNKQERGEALKKTEIIKKRLFALPEFKKSKFVMLYASKEDEVSTDDMIDEALEMGKRVALPLVVSKETIVPKEVKNRHKDLEKGHFEIFEPRKCQKEVELGKIDLVVVPGVAFDKNNVRLGRGKGYYDRFLKNLPPGKTTIGIAYDFQIVESLPKYSHDIPVSKVITN